MKTSLIVGPTKVWLGNAYVWTVRCACCNVTDMFNSKEEAQAFVGEVA